MTGVDISPWSLMRKIREAQDPRTRDYPLVLNPLFVFPMIAAYLYFVKVAGPRWMQHRKPFEIVNVIRVYNLGMVFINATFLTLLLRETYLPGGRYSLWCQGMNGTLDDDHERFYKYGWFFVGVRYADFLDTVFFVLRKKFTHITHLHVIHHTIVALNVWFWTLFAPEGHVALSLALNVFVHVVMYSYYFLATMGPEVRKYLWWKKYLTTMQIVQFVIIISHMSIPLFVDCGFPRHLVYIGTSQTFLILCLFINFYYQSYVRPRPPTSAKTRSNGSCENLGGKLRSE